MKVTSIVSAVVVASVAAMSYANAQMALKVSPEFLREFKDINGHYEDPYTAGCGSDEVNITIVGVAGAFCTPSCSILKACPTDVPAGVTAAPQCALEDSGTGKKYCALICSPSANDGQCGDSASCKPISGVGVCTYDS